MDLIQ